MKKVKVDDEYEFLIDKKRDYYLVNDKKQQFDVQKTSNTSLHLIYDNKPYQVDISHIDYEEKSAEIIVNGSKHKVQIQIDNQGFLKVTGPMSRQIKCVRQLKAPMPGLIVDLKVIEGQSVEKDEALVVLKAMKMENILKSPVDGIVSKILVAENQKIEKDAVLIQF